MTSSKKEKDSSSSRSRRRSSEGTITSSKKRKKRKDTDTDSLSSTSTDTIPPPPPPAKCPLRFMLKGLLETGEYGEVKTSGCPLRKVQLWHTIPLVLLAVVNLLLVVLALLGLAGYRIAMGVQRFVLTIVKSDLDCNPYEESLADTDDGSTLLGEK